MSDSRILSVKPIIHYPRVAQVGKTYLMTIDLEVETGDDWQYEEEEYPVYCTVDSHPDLTCRPVDSPVIVLQRYGGSYGAAKFLILGVKENYNASITATLRNAWGVILKVLKIESFVLSFHGQTQPQIINDEQRFLLDKIPLEPSSAENRRELTSVKLNSVSRKNPYLLGNQTSKLLWASGRESLFEFIKDMLHQGAPAIFIHGQRRMGASMIASQIPEQLQDEPYKFAWLSLEGKSQKPLVEVLYELSHDIREALELDIIIPSIAELHQNLDIFADRFLVEVQEYLGELELVLLLDEFDSLGNYRPATAATHLFPYFSKIINRHKFLHIIPVIGRRLDDLPTLLTLFPSAPIFEIGLLDEQTTRQLVIQPTDGRVFYEESALQAIWDLTAGHPYFIQVLCFALFSQAREDDWWQITRDDVLRVIDRALELGEGGLAWYWDGLPIQERVFLSAAAEVVELKLAKDPNDYIIRGGEPLELLEDSGILLIDSLHDAEYNLLKWKYLCSTEQTEPAETIARRSYKIAIELVRRWLIYRHRLKQELWELEDLNPEVSFDYKKARELRQRGQIFRAIHAYETVLSINPNHIRTLFELGECLLTTKAYNRAIILYERAVQVDLQRACNGLIRSYLGHALDMLEREQIVETELLINRVLEIDSDNPEALELLERIQTYRNPPDNQQT